MARKLIFVPIEILEERYSLQWYNWFTDAFAENFIEYKTVGDTSPREIKVGQFLDVFDTNYYKAGQLLDIVNEIASNPSHKYTVFFMDIWFPGIQMLAYMRDCAGVDIKICGMLHAGSWDPHDFITQQGCGPWAKPFEQSLFKMVDKIFLASKFHRDIIENHLGPCTWHKTQIVDWPCIDPIDPSYRNLKDDIVVFPHRLAPEKAPGEFDKIEEHFRASYPELDHVRFIKSKDVCKNKDSYYELLKRAKVAVSTARQETFGIAMVEAYNSWAWPIVPNRLSYKEIFEHDCRYIDLKEAADKIAFALKNYHSLEFKHKYGTKINWVQEIVNE